MKTYFLPSFSVFALLAFAPVASAVTIFTDSFTVQPSSNGWAESIVLGGTANAQIVSNGNQAVFDKIPTGSGTVNYSLERTISTVGFTNIALNLTAFQAATVYEAADLLRIEIATTSGGSFSSVLTDVSVWNGVNDLVGEGVPMGNTTPTATGFLALGAAAANNADFQVRISGVNSANDEDYFVDLFTLTGDVIPEPSRVLLGLFGLMGVTMVRRRK